MVRDGSCRQGCLTQPDPHSTGELVKDNFTKIRFIFLQNTVTLLKQELKCSINND